MAAPSPEIITLQKELRDADRRVTRARERVQQQGEQARPVLRQEEDERRAISSQLRQARVEQARHDRVLAAVQQETKPKRLQLRRPAPPVRGAEQTVAERRYGRRITNIKDRAAALLVPVIDHNFTELINALELTPEGLTREAVEQAAQKLARRHLSQFSRPLQQAAAQVVRATAVFVGEPPESGERADPVENLIQSYIDGHWQLGTRQLGYKLSGIVKDGADTTGLAQKVAGLRRTQAERLAGQGANFGVGRAQMYAMQDLRIQYAVWRTTGRENCPFCGKLNGRRWKVGETVVGVGATIRGDGRTFTPRQSRLHPPLHGGCDCYMSPVVETRSVSRPVSAPPVSVLDSISSLKRQRLSLRREGEFPKAKVLELRIAALEKQSSSLKPVAKPAAPNPLREIGPELKRLNLRRAALTNRSDWNYEIKLNAHTSGGEVRKAIEESFGAKADEVFAKMQEVLDKRQTWMSVNYQESLGKIIKDNEFKNQNQLPGRTGGSIFTKELERWDRFEEGFFGAPKNLRQTPSELPKYGAVDGADRMTAKDLSIHSNYGDTYVRLKPETRARTTITANDSLAGYNPAVPLNKIDEDYFRGRVEADGTSHIFDPDAREFMANPTFENLRKVNPGMYIEFQVHGKVTLADVAVIEVRTAEQVKSVKRRLKAAKFADIEVRVWDQSKTR